MVAGCKIVGLGPLGESVVGSFEIARGGRTREGEGGHSYQSKQGELHCGVWRTEV